MLTHDRCPRAGLGLDLPQTQRQELRLQLTLLLLERLVTPRGGRLALQVPELLLDFLSNIAQTLEVLACVANARFGLATALLVPRDAGRLLEEPAHVFRSRLDDPRDHVLLDDRVAAGTESGAQEELRDVLAPAAHAVQEVGR